jgi:hypothetical protein
LDASISQVSADASFAVPTLTCTGQNNDQALLITQEMASPPPNGGSAGDVVTAYCSDGTPTYSAQAFACGLGTFQRCQYCPASAGIAAGDSVSFSESIDEDSSNSMDSDINAGVSDSTSGTGASCQNEGAFNKSDKLYTGICSEGGVDAATQQAASGSSAGPPDADCLPGVVPQFSPVIFTRLNANETSLGSWHPKRDDMTAGATLQVKSKNFTNGGHSFKDVFVQD